MEEVYSEFAEIYDRAMREIPYEKWCGNIVRLLREQGISDGLVADLGCGTGTMTELLARAGFDMTGIDLSPEMLQTALEKRDRSGLPILYLNQDIRDFELYGTMRAFVSVCDTMNYLTEDSGPETVFRLVNNYLDPGGIFLFDLKTAYYFGEVLGDLTEYDDSDPEAPYVLENVSDPENRLNEARLTMFRKQPSGLYRKSEEYHLQRAWSVTEIREAAEKAGMIFISALDADTLGPYSGSSERIYVILREQGKESV